MAQSSVFRLNQKSLDSLAAKVRTYLDTHRAGQQELWAKLATIDEAYAMYKAAVVSGDGTDVVHGNVDCGINNDEFTIPVVISQVDSFVGYLADVYLNGSPFFPVVKTPRTVKEGETLEAIIDSHATLGGWGRQLLLFFKNAVKYNFAPIAIEWDTLPMYNVAVNVTNPDEADKINRANYMYNKLTAWDPYNSFYDKSVAPADVGLKGEHIGEISIISKIELKRIMTNYQKAQKGYQSGQALRSMLPLNGVSNYYMDRPTISNFITVGQRNAGGTNWRQWLNSDKSGGKKQILQEGIYERTKVYMRIIPSEHGITNTPEPNTPQIWKIDMIGHSAIICAERIYTALDCLPGMIAQPLEDMFNLQTKSIAENNITFQEQASKMINIRFAGARRAISDRQFYDASMINSSDINAKTPAPKIPVRIPLGSQRKLSDSVYTSPYDDTATQGVVQDAQRIVQFSQMLYGTNNPSQGQFQKGNKSRKEWDDTMGFTMNRLRLPAITIEFQIMIPLKEQIKWNIFQYREGGVFQNMNTGETYEVKAAEFEEMRKKALNFQLADGYTPASKLANPDLLMAGMNLIAQSPILQAVYGMSLPSMFAHFMSEGGIKNLDQYSPDNNPESKPFPPQVMQLMGGPSQQQNPTQTQGQAPATGVQQ